jgi:hypothetical protein
MFLNTAPIRGKIKGGNDMKEKIGNTAGKIWEVLRAKGEVNIAQLPRTLKQPSVIVYQALGWLAREDKLKYKSKANKTYVSLVDSERL